MTPTKWAAAILLLGLGIGLASSLSRQQEAVPRVLKAAAAQETTEGGPADLAALKADVEILKQKATDQAHVMTSVSYHFSNMWFAAQHGNWPLAQFYWNETRSHLRWAVRVIPVRKDNANQDIDLRTILEAVENSQLKQLDEAIKAQDRSRFADVYKMTLESCYSCHKAADKPFITLHIPSMPADPMIDFDPNASRIKKVDDGSKQ
jgi:hypothetical protein